MTDAELLQAVTRAIRGGSSSSAGHVLAAERAIAAIRASGRLAPEVAGDVEEGAYEAAIKAAIAEGFGNSDRRLVRVVLNASAPLIAAAAEAKAREECARIADEAKRMREELFEQNGASINAARAVQAEEIAAAIRTGAAS